MGEINMIPIKDLEMFVACNNAHHYWAHKQSFYQFKDTILKQYGEPDGYDRQTISTSCWSCDGTGKYKKRLPEGCYVKELCWGCWGTGIYSERVFCLQRYLLNGFTFHKPLGRISFGRVHDIDGNTVMIPLPEFKNEITGHVKHEPIKNIDPTACLLSLYWKYDKDRFYLLVNLYVSSFRTRTKNKFMKLYRNTGSQIKALQQILGFKIQEPINDDLPF